MSNLRIAYTFLAVFALFVAVFGAFILYRQFFVVAPAIRPDVRTVVTQEQMNLVDILDQSSQTFDASAAAQGERAALLEDISGGQASSSASAAAAQENNTTQEERAGLLKSLGQ